MTVKSIQPPLAGGATFLDDEGNYSATGGGGGPATALDTTGAAVDVSGSAPPSAGDVLTAVDATHATWQAPTSGPVADADYGDITVSAAGTVWTLDLNLATVAAPSASVGFAQQQATQFRIENRTSDPGSPAVGEIWLRTDL